MDNELWRWIWTFAVVVFTFGEALTAGFFMLPFAIGAFFAAFVAWLDGPGALQWALFFTGAGLSFAALRLPTRKQDVAEILPTGVARYIGKRGLVLTEVNATNNTGMVRVETDEWRATVRGEPLAPGTEVVVISLVGNRLVVEPAEDD